MAINEVKGRINLESVVENEKIGLNLFSFLLTMLEWVAWEWDINAHS